MQILFQDYFDIISTPTPYTTPISHARPSGDLRMVLFPNVFVYSRYSIYNNIILNIYIILTYTYIKPLYKILILHMTIVYEK